MRITNIELTDGSTLPGHVRVQALVAYDDGQVAPETYWFEFPRIYEDRLGASGNPWLIVALPLAAVLSEPIRIERPVDPLLLEGAMEIMGAWRYWFPKMHVVPIEADTERTNCNAARGKAAQFFSGGVDSFFTALRHPPGSPSHADALLFVWGFDIPLTAPRVFDGLRGALQKAADDLGKTLILSASNIRQVRFRTVPWDTLGHGVAMGCAGLHLERAFERMIIASTDGYRETGPWGSHVLTDHHMSTSNLRFVHDGPAFSRLEKLRVVSASSSALASLHVCYKSTTSANCGKCEKCFRTMIGLELLGVLNRCELFGNHRLDFDRVAHIYCPKTREGSLRLYYDELLALARESGRADLQRAIKTSIRRSTWRHWLLDRLYRMRRAPFLRRFVGPLERALLSGLVR